MTATFDPGRGYSWRGHAAPHPLPCPGTITVGSGKTQASRPCPCARDHTSQEKPL